MTDHYTDIDLPRFCRPIGVTDLASVDARAVGRFPTGTLRPFAGVLDTTTRRGRRGALPQLAYLTLAPLVTQGLTTTDDDAGPARRSRDEAVASTESGDGPDEAQTEPTVREVLRDPQRAQPDAGSPAAGGGDDAGSRTSDLGGSGLTTLERTVRDLRGDASGGESRDASSGEGPGWRAGADPSVDSEHDERREPVTDATTLEPVAVPPRVADAGADAANPGDWSGAGPEITSVADGQSNANAPTMTVVTSRSAVTASGIDAERASSGRARSPRSDLGGPSVEIDDADPDTDPPAGGRRGPNLTVERAVSPDSTGAATGADSTESAPSASQTDQLQSPQASDDQPEVRTVLQPDGSVNERVLDRLYQELTRKQRLERSREGQ